VPSGLLRGCESVIFAPSVGIILASGRSLPVEVVDDGPDRRLVLGVISFGSFAQLGARLLVSPIVPLVILEFDVTKSAVGIALTGMWACYALGQFPGGVLADRYGESCSSRSSVPCSGASSSRPQRSSPCSDFPCCDSEPERGSSSCLHRRSSRVCMPTTGGCWASSLRPGLSAALSTRRSAGSWAIDTDGALPWRSGRSSVSWQRWRRSG